MMRTESLLHAVKTVWSLTTTLTRGSGRDAGPRTTAPVAASKALPWHGQLIRPLPTWLTRHPWCVHTAEKQCTLSPASRVSTIGGVRLHLLGK